MRFINKEQSNMDQVVIDTLKRVQRREVAGNIPSVAKSVADRLLNIRPAALAARAVKRDPGIRTLLHSKNPLDKFQGAMDDIFGSGMVAVIDPHRAIKDVTSKGDIYHTLYTATLPATLQAEDLENLVQVFDKHRIGMHMKHLAVTPDGSLLLTVVCD
jgi:hypothetical protein